MRMLLILIRELKRLFMSSVTKKRVPAISSLHAALVALVSHSFCCVLPLILVALGSSGVLAGFNLGKYHAIFSTVGVIALAVGFYLYWQETRKPCGCCACSAKKAKIQRRQSFAILMAAVVLQVGIWGMMAFQSKASAQDVQSLSSKIASASIQTDSEVYYDLQALHCIGCAMEAEVLVRSLPGVASAELNFSKALLGIRFDSKQISADSIEASIKKLGIEYKKNTLSSAPSMQSASK